MDPERIFPDIYVPNAQGVPYHQKWENANKDGDTPKWRAFRDAVLAYKKGTVVVIPTMATKYGRALVAAGRLHMSVLDLGAVWPPSEPPSGSDSLPLAPPNGYAGPLTITQGGTYSGIAHQATGPGNAITIATSQPVIIEDSWIRNLDSGDLIKGENFQIRNLTLRGCRLFGGTGRVYDAEGVEHIRVENCTIDKTTGMNHAAAVGSAPTIVCTKNRARNIQGVSGYLSAFFKVREIQTAQIEVSWNEIVNEYNLSHPEDIISLFKSAFCDVHNNYIEHNSTPGNAYNTSSQGTITCDYPDGVGPVCHDIHIYDNQMVDTVNGVLIPSNSYNILVERNRLIQDGKLPDGITQMGNGWSGWAILPPVTNCHMHDNVTGYVNRDGNRVDWDDNLAAPEGRAAEITLNTTLPDPITRQMEIDEWTTWQAKLVANSITVGA